MVEATFDDIEALHELLSVGSELSANRAPIDDIEDWSKTQAAWRQDCLRRLALSDGLTQADLDELFAIIKAGSGLAVAAAPPEPVPFTKAHFSGGKRKPIALKGIVNVDGVNRLVSKASIAFSPRALSVVYGRNGSGKSGFVRILRTACRTRINNPAKLKVLADVYGDGGEMQTAEIVIDDGTGDFAVQWTPGMAAVPQLMQVSVFDTTSAQLYVDEGNQIRFLPFGLALLHRLNAVCLDFKAKLEAERAAEVGGKVGLTSVTFQIQRDTEAQRFNKTLDKDTTDAEIDSTASFEPADQERLESVSSILSSGAARVADLGALARWTREIARECETSGSALSDESLAGLSALKSAAMEARKAAEIAADRLFSDEPLPGVGSDTWRTLWRAARDFSIAEAYPGREFPVTDLEGTAASCVLCQQPLLKVGAARMLRFQKYMDDALDRVATAAEKSVADAGSSVPALPHLRAGDFADHLQQLRGREPGLADTLAEFQRGIVARREEATARLAGQDGKPVPGIASPHAGLDALAEKIEGECKALRAAEDLQERQKLEAEKAELEDRKHLAPERDKLVARRDLLKADAAYEKALADVQTKGITQRANELMDKHLTAAVQAHFDTERDHLDIAHLKVGLTRKSGQTKAEFEVDPQSTIAKVPSDILSEGEQRALALAGFLTEVALTDGSGPIVVDDPVSSLDRDRGRRVAERLADEATRRQVVVFTHDIIFFNELCLAAEGQGIEPVTTALFSDKKSAGRIDPAGMSWKGLAVSKRIGIIKNSFAPIAKLHASSPADYEFQVKNLYGRVRDTYERVIEEVIFHDIVRRGSDEVQTLKLRYVSLSDALAIRFYEGMSNANTHSHDNPAADTVPVPNPDAFREDLAALEHLIADLKKESEAAEAARPQMRPKK